MVADTLVKGVLMIKFTLECKPKPFYLRDKYSAIDKEFSVRKYMKVSIKNLTPNHDVWMQKYLSLQSICVEYFKPKEK